MYFTWYQLAQGFSMFHDTDIYLLCFLCALKKIAKCYIKTYTYTILQLPLRQVQNTSIPASLNEKMLPWEQSSPPNQISPELL